MDFTIDREHELLRKMYREFAENEVKPLAEEIDEEERFPEETVKKMAKLGMLGIYFPKEYGGAGADVLAYVMAAALRLLSFLLIPLCAQPPFLRTARKSRSRSICPSCALVSGSVLSV